MSDNIDQLRKKNEEIERLKSGLSICRNALKEIDGYLSEKSFENGKTVYRNNIGAFSTLHKNAIEALAPLPLKKEDIEDKKSTWSSGWDSAITVANNICVQISDHYDIIDDAARSDGADSCAKQIRKRLGDKSYYPETFAPDLSVENSNDQKDLIIQGLEEGAEMWKAEYDRCRHILHVLVQLKNIKDTDGKTEYYKDTQPIAWAEAKEFLKQYQHQ